jgi:hypothetical protein
MLLHLVRTSVECDKNNCGLEDQYLSIVTKGQQIPFVEVECNRFALQADQP